MLSQMITKISSTNRETRREGLEELGDYLEYADWEPAEVTPPLNQLIGMVSTEQDNEIREIILNDLVLAFNRGKVLDVPLDLIADVTGELPAPLMSYCLELLALSHDQRFRAFIEQFRIHPSKLVRDAANEALVELAGRPQRTN
jgi:hypothetical protein